MRFLLIIGSILLTMVSAMAENLTPLIDENSGIAIPSFLTDDQISNIDTAYNGDWEYFVGGGVAAFDCNDDHYLDLFIAGGETQSGLYINQSERGGFLTFAHSANETLSINKVIGAYPIDINGDGITDLMTLRHGENKLFKGLGNCHFELANETWDFDGGDAWSTSFSAMWEKDQNWPTIAIGNYIDQKAQGAPWGTCADNKLFRPMNSARKFAPPESLKAYCTLSMLFSDWNKSGTMSLRVSNDRQYNKNGREQLWRVEPNKIATEYTKQDGFKKLNIWGMGIASHDVNGDGYPDYFLTSMGDNKLRLNKADGKTPKFKDMAFKLGITAHRPWTQDNKLLSTAWHAQFADFNNDGNIDLFIAKGNVDQMPDFTKNDPNNLLLGKPDGTFFEAANQSGMLSTGRARGATVADFNLDGLLDIAEVNREEGLGIWRNLGGNQDNIIAGHDDIAQSKRQKSAPLGNWVAVNIRHLDYTKSVIGAWIELRTSAKVQHKEITIGGGHASGILGLHHFGIGTNQQADIRITWPDGQQSDWLNIKANKFANIKKGNSAVTYWLPSNKAKLMQ